jgi:hypothetical protein
MRVLVCGGRDFDDRERLFSVMDWLHEGFQFTALIQGEARGADRLSGQWADERGIKNLRFPANWDLHGRRAGPIRNRQMLANGKPDLVVAFPGGAGTSDMIRQAQKAGIRVIRATN